MISAVRAHGLADVAGETGLSDHACCVYRCDDDLELVRDVVIDFVHDGLSLGQRIMVVSEKTVDAHADHIRTKLGLRSRAEIAAWAVSNGLLTPSDRA